MAEYGYMRVSSADQHEDRQFLDLQKLKISPENLFTDKQSGKDFNRPKYQELIGLLQSGDILYITSIDRLGRNYEEIIEQWRVVTKGKDADIVVLDMPILDTRSDRDLTNRLIADIVLQLLSYVSQKERENIRKRQSEGIAAARLRGVRFGRPEKKSPENFGELVRKWERGQMKTAELLKICNMSRSTLYAKLREYKITRKNWK